MKRLVIAEKPSVGMSIASVLGAKDRKDGYIEGRDYIVSWGFGHLAELANADTYDEKYAKWRYDDLPIVPANWKYKIPRDKYSQFETLKKLMNRADVSDVINACDAGREGELIFRNIYKMTGCKKPIYRLWISSMEDTAIEQGFHELKDGKEYDNLFAAARCREWADWLVGINATRLFSILYHRTLNVGRVVSPTLALIVQREAEIGAFKPEPFYTAELDFGSFTATSEKFKKKSDADAVIPKAGEPVVVKSVTSKEKTEKAPALYDLTTLQRDANRQLGYTAQQTLDYVQSLYEKKLCTYPRTDSRYLTDDMADGVNAVVACSVGICDEAAPPEVLSRQICNSKKVSDHHAIIPTLVAGETDINALPAGEREIIKLIAKQVLRAVCDSFRYRETVAVIFCGERTFTAKGKTVQKPGWKIYSEKEQTDKVLPELADGDELKVANAEIKEGTTKPPSHFTEDSLLSAMEVAGAKDMPDDAERKGLGTPATRAGIIEKLIATGFVERKKAKKTVSLVPAHTGVSLITVLPEQLQSPLLTAEWEHKLKMVEHGELDADAFMAEISRMVSDLVKTYSVIKGAEVLFPSGRDVIGKCPRCGGDVTESKKGFFCESNDCRFGLWRDNKFLTGKKITLTKKMTAALLKDGKIPVKGIFSEKTGKSYDATLVMTDDGAKTIYSLDFGKK
ncbi:MAG: DNA topoisomerase 3 [Ruminococcus bromii]|nr:DNA topoisomerase 3 [Ruminococcus bromii]